MLKTISLSGEHTIVADDILVLDPNSGVGKYANSISGGFTYPAGSKPCSIVINKGVEIYGSACHAWLGYPETVLCRYKDGTFHVGKYKYASQIPRRSEVVWAVGGMGLLTMYKPSEEGFARGTKPDGTPFNYTDVLRQTSHAVLAIKGGKCYLIYIHSRSGYQTNLFIKSQGFDMAIMLDGGHITAINGATPEAKHRLTTMQGCIIQGISRPLVAWDAGHNILNQSNVSPDGTYEEWEANIKVVKLAIEYLKPMGVDSVFVDVLEKSQAVELPKLVAAINATKADICVSRHTNAAANLQARGLEVYCYQMAGESLKLARCLHENLKPLAAVDRGIKDGQDLYLVWKTDMPCALVEIGFHTNTEDLKLLKSEEYMRREAMALAKGVAAYFKLQV